MARVTGVNPKITMVHPSNPVVLRWECECSHHEKFELAEGGIEPPGICGECGQAMRLYRPIATQGRL